MFGTKDKSIGQLAAMLIGVVYLGGGLIGMCFTGFSGFTSSQGTHLFGLFAVNPFHNVFHIIVGAGLLWSSTRSTTVAEGFLLGVGAIYVVATVCGFTYAHIPVIALVSSSDADNYLHGITGLTAIFASIVSSSQTSASRPKADPRLAARGSS
jgi:hypothetical protein